MFLDDRALSEFDGGGHGIEAPQLLGPEDRHENGARVGTAIAAAPTGDLAHHDGGTDLALGVVVGRVDALFGQEREQAMRRPPQPLGDADDVRVARRFFEDLQETALEPVARRLLPGGSVPRLRWNLIACRKIPATLSLKAAKPAVTRPD